MATQNQIAANRKNAKKSTGPKTEEGKAVVAQNAIKHGLTAQNPLIYGEAPLYFQQFNDAMLAQLTPQNPLETILANRIITLSWQLNRAPRLQAATFNHMIDSCLLIPPNPEKELGKTVANDFATARSLDRLQIYERRIENSLYKAINQLEKIQQNPKRYQPIPQPQPQNKPNPEVLSPARPEKDQEEYGGFEPDELLRLVAEAMDNKKKSKTNPISPTSNPSCKNKPNSTQDGRHDPSTSYQPPTKNSFEKTNPIYPAPEPKKHHREAVPFSNKQSTIINNQSKRPHPLSNAARTGHYKTPKQNLMET